MKELIRVGIRLLVIYAASLFVNSLPGIAAYEVIRSQVAAQAGANQPAIPLAAYAISWVVYLAFSVLLWTKADAISNIVLIHRGNAVAPGVDLDYEKLLSVGLSILSVYLLVSSIPDLARAVMMRITASQTKASIFSEIDLVRENASILADIVRIGLSLSLIAYHRKIAAFIQSKAIYSKKTKSTKE
jgi:hypothetical protein